MTRGWWLLVCSPEFEFEKDPKTLPKPWLILALPIPWCKITTLPRGRHTAISIASKVFGWCWGIYRYSHFGEGQYDKTEETIQTLLEEAGMSAGSEPIDNPSYSTSARTPETYLGYAELRILFPENKLSRTLYRPLPRPHEFPDSQFAYVGDWMLTSEYAAPAPNAELLMQFDAKEVYLVARPKTTSGTIQVFDGQASSFGDDVEDGVVAVDSDRLYKLIKLPSAGKHQLRLVFPEDSVELYAFTFG